MTRSLLTRIILVALFATLPAVAFAQAQRFGFPAPSPDVIVRKDIPYATSGTTTLMMDVYRPPNSANTRPPVLIFFNRATGAERGEPFYASWARTAASKGLVAILPDLRDGSESKDFALLVPFLTAHAAEQGIDPDAIAIYAGSGNVSAALPAVQDPGQTAVKAAVMYYGTGPVTKFRLDLPILYVRAGLDRPSVNRAIGELAALAVSQNAPVTVLNHPTGHHGFEAVDDDDATREVIALTLDFVVRSVSAPYQTALRRALPEATAAGHVQAGNFREAAAVYAGLLASHPDDARLRLSYGEALLGDRQFGPACAEFEKLRDKGLGYRDLGLPAARACVQNGDADKAIGWLRSIPARYLPVAVGEEPVFAPIRDREDFKALFRR